MARHNGIPGGAKKPPPQLVDLSPPKSKTPRNGERRRELAPLPEVGRDGGITSRGQTNPNPTPQRHPRKGERPGGGRPRPHGGRPPQRPSGRPQQRRRNQQVAAKAKRILTIVVCAGLLITVLVLVGVNVLAGNALAVYAGNQHMGYMTLSRETTSDIFQGEVMAHLEARYLTEVVLGDQIAVAPARFVSNRDIVSRQDMISRVGNRIEYQIVARAIYIDGNFEVMVRGDRCVADAQEFVKEQWRTPNTIRMEFVSPWEIRHVTVSPGDERLRTATEANGALDRMIDSTHPHTVQSGESLGILAPRFNTTPDRIAIVNNMSSIHETIHPGNVLLIPSRRSLLALERVEEIVEVEEIPMPTEVRPNNEMLVSTTTVAQEGSAGERHIARHVTFINGDRTSEVELEAVVVREPVTHIIYEGTRPAPSGVVVR